jgi:hypothetical protein
MRIYYSPYYIGSYYLDLKNQSVLMDVQVLETQGLLTQLALHAGIHQQIPSYPERLAAYHDVLLHYDASHPNGLFHHSIEIDSMSVAKSLLQWRDTLALSGWRSDMNLEGCTRLNELAAIDAGYSDDGLAVLLQKLSAQLALMSTGQVTIPNTYRELTIELPCSLELLPDYLQPLFHALTTVGVTIEERPDDAKQIPQIIKEYSFSQQWKAEAWLAHQDSKAYDLWINTNSKRLDNWLHMSGKSVCGSEMTESNPQITQLFLLAVQLFQRPLNVNILVQYLSLPLCPLDWKLSKDLIYKMVREGGFYNEKVQECIDSHKNDELFSKSMVFLPFDLRDEASALALVEESDVVDKKVLLNFMEKIGKYATQKANGEGHLSPDDARIPQLRFVADLCKALIRLVNTQSDSQLSYAKLIQWAQALYESADYTLYHAQVGSRLFIDRPQNMISDAHSVVWCDFYGDVSSTLSTDFLSPYEQEQLKKKGILLWDNQHESDLMNQMMARPLRKANQLTIITCKQCGATILPIHPLYYQLPKHGEPIDGDSLYDEIATKDVVAVDNHRESDAREICFDAEKHPINWMNTESFSSMEKLLQDPFDYFMNYPLNFKDVSESEIKLSTTYGYVAHDTIEYLFTSDKGNISLKEFVESHYEEALHRAFLRKGALLLLPENHLDKDRITYQLRKCVNNLADLVEENGLTVIKCEQEEEEQLDFEEGISMKGYIDMVLKDNAGNEVVFDLKWTSKKDKFQKTLKNNRALQLAIYKAMLEKHPGHPQAVRTAYYVMPLGKLFSTDNFSGSNFEMITPDSQGDVMDQLRKGYTERRREINEGKIETADNEPIGNLEYAATLGVFPLDSEGSRPAKKTENKYSDYKCFTI